MEKNINLDAHSSLIIADGSIVEINGQKVLLTLVKDADASETKKIDLHKDSWAVYNDGSQRFKDTVIKWINEHKNPRAQGVHIANYYGVISGGSQVCFEGTENFTHILTIDEFCALAYPEKEEGSELVGKWLRYKKEGFDLYNKWYEVKTVNPAQIMYGNSVNVLTIGDKKEHFGDACFDLANPLDYNPETLVGKYYNGYKIEGIEFSQNENNMNCPYFIYGESKMVACKDITPSDVTDTPPVKSLKYEDCFERVKPVWFVDTLGKVKTYHSIREDGVKTERQAKQLAATIKLMTIMHDANGGEWVPIKGENRYLIIYDESYKQITFLLQSTTLNSPIYFRDRETAQRAYEENKEIFHDYFGTGGENE